MDEGAARRQPRGVNPSSRCTGVYRSLGDAGGSCSLGRHCLVLALVRDHDAYRGAHTRFSDASPPLESSRSSNAASFERAGDDRGLLDVIADAMGRLDEINPPAH